MEKIIFSMLIVVTSLFSFGECNSFKILGPDWIDIKFGNTYTVNRFNIYLIKEETSYRIRFYDGDKYNSFCYISKENFIKLKEWQTK